MEKNGRKRIVIFGAGMVAAPAVEELATKYNVTLVDANLESLEEIGNKVSSPIIPTYPHLQLYQRNAADKSVLAKLIPDADVVISFLPATMHGPIAEHCVSLRKPLVTASYVSPQISALDKEAKEKGVLILNECGLDPGIDHMSAMKLFDEIHSRGGTVKSFESYCGGLPSNSENNPWGYQLSWSPRGVLLAAKNPAKFLRDGKQVDIQEGKIFRESFEINRCKSFEGYYNRDSMSYIDTYGLQGEVETFIRGTIRYKGWSETLEAMTNLGLLETEKLEKRKSYASLLRGLETDREKECVDAKMYAATYLGIRTDSPILKKLDWLGIFSEETIPENATTALDAVVGLMIEKMQYKDGQTDLVLLQHRIIAEYKTEKEEINSTLVYRGTPNGDSAMAQTVGLPVAYAAELIVEGKLDDLVGVQIPTIPRIYTPILNRLDQEKGIVFIETVDNM